MTIDPNFVIVNGDKTFGPFECETSAYRWMSDNLPAVTLATVRPVTQVTLPGCRKSDWCDRYEGHEGNCIAFGTY